MPDQFGGVPIMQNTNNNTVPQQQTDDFGGIKVQTDQNAPSPGRGGGGKLTQQQQNQVQPDNENWFDKFTEFARPLISGGVGSGIAAAAAPFTEGASLIPAALGLAGTYATDAGLQHLQQKQPTSITNELTGTDPSSLVGTLNNTTEMLLGGKLIDGLIGKFGRPIANAVKESFQPGSVANPQLVKLAATYSQFLDPSTKSGRLAQFLEDTFARGTKNAASSNTAGLAQSQSDAQFRVLAGRSTSTLQNPQIHSDLIRAGIQDNLDQLNDAFNTHMTEANFYKPKFQQTTPISTFGPNPTTQASPLKQINPNYNPVKYADAIQNAAAVRALMEPYEMGDSLQQLLTKSHLQSIPFIDNILDDSKQLQRTLNTGGIKIPGTNNVTTDTTRDDLRGYYLNKLIDGASKQDSVTGKTISIDPQQLMNDWRDQQTKESTRLLFNGANISNIQQLFKNIAMTQQKQMSGLSTAAKIYYSTAGIEMAGSLLSGQVRFAMIPTGIHLGGWALGRLMTDPKTARIMIAAGSGQPLGVSQQTAASLISKALNGVMVDVIGKDGKTTKGEINNGQFIPSMSQ